MSAADLKPCPCGGTPEIQSGYCGVSDWWLVECPVCERSTHWRFSEEEAVADWNGGIFDERR